MAEGRGVPVKFERIFGEWRVALCDGRLAQATCRVYASEVASFLKTQRKPELTALTSEDVARHVSGATRRARSRRLSALSEFFAFAVKKGAMSFDPTRILKYRRSVLACEGQMGFPELLKGAGIGDEQLKEVRWVDFVEPLLHRRRNHLRVGRSSIEIPGAIWRRLEVEFRARARTQPLSRLLRKRIA